MSSIRGESWYQPIKCPHLTWWLYMLPAYSPLWTPSKISLRPVVDPNIFIFPFQIWFGLLGFVCQNLNIFFFQNSNSENQIWFPLTPRKEFFPEHFLFFVSKYCRVVYFGALCVWYFVNKPSTFNLKFIDAQLLIWLEHACNAWHVMW